MRLGQTTVVFFLGKLGASLFGFLATVYFARVLGSGVLGVYFLAVGVVSWLLLGSKMGFNSALTKRLSERGERIPYISAGILLSTFFYLFWAVTVFAFRTPLNEYFGEPIYQFVLLMLLARILFGFVNAIIKGKHLVHFLGVQKFLGTFFRAIFQVILVYFGFKLVGMIVGYAAAFFAVALLGVAILIRYSDQQLSPVLPEHQHFRSLFNYAKFSWMGRLEARTYSWTDIVVLGIFVPSNLIGIYGVCWTLSSVMILFGDAISQTMFPEVSEVSSKEGYQKVAGYLNDSLAYAGLITIPGLVGASILGRGVLNIYGDEFSEGYLILVLLIGAVLLHSYQKQFLNVLNAVDRPDLSFRVNSVFVAVNLLLNFVLVYRYGWIGAAVATLVSSLIGAGLAHRAASSVLDFGLPLSRIGKQTFAAVMMGCVVYSLVFTYQFLNVSPQELAPTLVAVGVGAGVYFFLLTVVSSDFRRVVRNNTPK